MLFAIHILLWLNNVHLCSIFYLSDQLLFTHCGMKWSFVCWCVIEKHLTYSPLTEVSLFSENCNDSFLNISAVTCSSWLIVVLARVLLLIYSGIFLHNIAGICTIKLLKVGRKLWSQSCPQTDRRTRKDILYSVYCYAIIIYIFVEGWSKIVATFATICFQ